MTLPLEHSELQPLVELIELQLENCLSAEQFAELEHTIRSSEDARRFYVEYLDLHGGLHWDLALTSNTEADEQPAGSEVTPVPGQRVSPRRVSGRAWLLATACTLAAAAVLVFSFADGSRSPSGPSIADINGNDSTVTDSTVTDSALTEASSGDSGDEVVEVEGTPDSPAAVRPDRPDEHSGSIADAATTPASPRSKTPRTPPTEQPESRSQPPESPHSSSEDSSVAVAVVDNTKDTVPSASDEPREDSDSPGRESSGNDRVASTSSNQAVVATIDRLIRNGWSDSEVLPSVRAEDSEWLRRVYLDTVGHIPSAEQVRAFLADKRPNKRSIVVTTLLDDQDYVRNWTTIWTNLLIGRSNPREVNRPALQKFLRESFARNRGWDDVVADFISAEGSHEENGATNFLLAHLNNQAVPATAITAKVFLGQQLHCTQCHNHPFNNRTQDEFWAFNSFFKQVEVRDRPKPSNPRVREVVLRNTNEGGPTFYETRQGIMKAAFPSFEGRRINGEDDVDRREELARLMTQGESPQIARAFVNRVWQHYFGAGFTPQVDDMGPHVAVSHPELLDTLTREFVRSGYDVKQLIRWICNSEAYNLTSRFRDDSANSNDNPALGNVPLFSRVYVKQMSVEQLFDSLLVATDAQEVFGSTWEAVEKRRQEWLQQFVMAWNTDENDEAYLFDGTIPQALMMMNGKIIDLALNSKRGTLLDRVVRSRASEKEKIETITLAALSRQPTRREIAAVRKVIRESAARRDGRSGARQEALRTGLQDLFWACLNSNEFILNH